MQGQGPPGGYPPNPYGQPPPQHNLQQGRFDMGGGQQLNVKINGQTPENYLTNKASGMVWGWIIGLGIIAVLVIGGGILGIYVYMKAQSDGSDTGAGAGAAAAAAKPSAWDGKSTFTCSGNDKVALTGVTSTAGVNASGNCVLTLTGVNITAPTGIEASANAKVLMTGGSIKSTTAINASANAKVDLVGTTVAGKVTKAGGAKVTGAP